MKRLSAVVFSSVALVLAVSAHAYTPGRYYHTGETKDKVIALSFDDGPGVFTPKILEYLKEQNARATFFIEGDQVAAYPQFVRQIRDAGHELANHTYYHKNYRLVKDKPREQLDKELTMTEDAIRKALGDPNFKMKAVRMPNGAYGKFNKDWLLPLLKERGYALVHWTHGSDWHMKNTAEKMASEYIAAARPGAVFLMHDGGRRREKTFEALKIMVPTLKRKGYRFVACEDLLSGAAVESVSKQ
jgi:peptidoglycan-N-acetylglucosamine deacetylase